MTPKQPGSEIREEPGALHRYVSDPRTMRALAHPMRMALLEALRREESLTATRAAEMLGDSPGNMSWHLQTLAKYGFVEEAGGGRGRSRPWRRVRGTFDFDTSLDDPESAVAVEALEASFQDRSYQRLRDWWAERRSYATKWRKAAFTTDATTYLTPEELRKMGQEIEAVLIRYGQLGRGRGTSRRQSDALPVHVVAFGHPLTDPPPRATKSHSSADDPVRGGSATAGPRTEITAKAEKPSGA